MAPLEHEQPYRFGEFTINRQDRVLLKDGALVAIAPKAVDALLLLLSRPGHVFGKREILSTLWPDRFVEENSIASTIAQLRKALGDDVGQPKFIETIPKRGYRWIANLAVGNGATVKADNLPGRRKLAPRVWLAMAGTGCLALAGGLAIMRTRSHETEMPQVRPFTTYPGGEYEPAFSPDGQKLAFVWNGRTPGNFEVYVRPVNGEGLLRLTADGGNKGGPTWSRDGKSIAYLRYDQDPSRSGVYIAPASGGPDRKVASTFPIREIHDRHLDWSPVADEIAVVDKTSTEGPFSIDIVKLSTGQRRRLTMPPAGTEGDTGPAFSRDGRYVAFRRTTSASVNEIYVVAASGGQPRRLTFDNQYTATHAWSEDGRSLVFSSKREARPGLWRVQFSGGTPVPVLNEWVQYLAVARVGKRLAYSQWTADTNIWRLDVANPEVNPEGPLIASTKADMSPQYSPRADKIAFRSDRTGTTEIWVCDADGGNQRAITNWHGSLAGSPRWSPNGRRIAFDARPAGKSHIFTINESGNVMEQVTTGESDDVLPSWSHDGKSLYFASMRSGTWQVWKTASRVHANADGAVQLTHRGGFSAFEAVDGREVYYAKGSSTDGLWRVPVDGGEEEPVVDLKGGLWGYWAMGNGRIFFVDAVRGGPGELWSVDLATLERRKVRRMTKGPVWGDGGLAVSADGRSVLYAQTDSSGSDIFLVEHWR